MLSTTFQNPTESSEVSRLMARKENDESVNCLCISIKVRMAAFTLLILANPPAYRWQRIAVSTWFEHSAQVCVPL